jgi:hypothetical protein
MLNSYKNQKININIIFLILYFLKTVFTTSICDNKSPIYGLYLNTSFTQDYSNTNLSIISGCSIDKYWRVKTGKETNFHIHKVLEDESINRRILKFGYNASKLSKLKFSEKYIINLKYNILEGNGFISFGSQTYQNAKEKKDYEFIFEPELDINYITYITYYCEPENIFFKANIDITILDTDSKEKKVFPIEVIKICKHSEELNDDSIDICHAIIIIIAVGIIIFSNWKSFESKLESTILKKFPEVWIIENLSMINLLLVILLYILYIQNILNYFLYVTTIIVSIISLVMVLEALLKNTPIKKNLNNRSIELEFVGSLSMYLIFCIILSSVFFLIYEWTHNILINDIISISISIQSIRIFKFTSFKYILCLCFLIWCYQVLYMIFKSSDLLLHYYNGILINQFDISFPILILCTQFTPYSSLYTEYVCLSIGEVILPGIYINYLYRFDKKVKLHGNFYYYTGLSIFIIGLFIKILLYCYASLKIPAFSFIFPCLTIIILYFAYQRKQLEEMLNGFQRNPFVEYEIGSTKLESFAQSYYRNSQISSFDEQGKY